MSDSLRLNMARGTIKKYILPEDLLQFAGNTTARDLWVALAKKHIPNVRNFRMQIQQQLKDFEMLSGESIDDYFRRFYKIGYKASLISMKIEPEDALLHLIRGLSSDYDGVKSVLRHMESIESVDQLQDMLKTEEGELRLQRNKAHEVSLMSLSRTHDGARVGPSQGAGAGNADGGRSRKACLYCNKEGHFIAECRKKANDEQRGIWRPALKGLRQKPQNPPALAAPPPAPPPVAPAAQPPAAAQAAAPPRPAQGQRRQLIARVYSSQQDDWERELWLFDTGAEVHVTGDKDKLRNYQHCGSDCKVWLKTANGSVVRPEGHGRVMFRSSCFETDVEVDVYHAPGIMGHILSLKALEGSFGPNVVPQFSGVLPHVEIGGAPAIELEKINGLFYAEDSSYNSWMGRYGSDRCLSGKKVREELRKVKLAITKQDSNLGVLWHKRYGHLGFDALAKAASSDMVTGFGASVDDVVAAKGQFCKPCAEGKQTRQPHPSTGNVTSKRLDMVHMDLCGPLPVKSWNNAKYWVTFYDDCTKFSEVRCITDKTVVPETVKEVIKLWERQTGDKVRRIHTDRGLEYVNEELASTLRDMGIFHEKLIQMGFEVSNANPSLYIRRDLDGQICTYLLVYVDDVLIASHDEQTVLEVKEEIKQLYECRDMGEAEVFWGLVIKRDRETHTLTVSQEHMIHELIERYGMVNADPRSIPMSPGTILMRAADGEVLDRSRYPYIELVGSLMYITNCTRPDIAQAVGVLTRHMSAPTEQHWRAAKAVVRFLLATPQCGIVFGGERVEEGLIGYTDSDYAGCIESRKSTGGYVFTLHGGSVSWSSRLQRTVTSSTMEAEYMAASEATKEALWLRLLLSELGYSLRPTTINCDSQSAIKITKNPVISGKSKHIAVRYHMVREQVARGAVVMEDCRSDDMADILTKPLPLEKFAKHQKSMGVCKI
ncbi:hypothetical protein VaNZ11_004728 [Volvox africanus]|uniref:Uncharacterized protein n=1 Tax=Volvox africanus TaxID=51714 RepID=A0ABQ5RXK5_9CHLO|nr:hypothetical protein VaNZ11_004728 [Volvox africanus]